tara:strand:+ start:861 stop:1184 length:324 start_codon:yes stop_codon:yes gene_type:complete
MSYSIQNKLCDDVLGIVKSFRGKTKKEILFSECLEDLNNCPSLRRCLRKDECSKHVYKVMRFKRKIFEQGYYYDNKGKKEKTFTTYLFTSEGEQVRPGFPYPPINGY